MGASFLDAPILDAPLPLVAAPMAGGPSTPELARAVAAAGAFPFLAGGYRTPADLATDIEQLRRSVPAFGVNLFVPSAAPFDRSASSVVDAVSDYVRELRPEAEAYGLDLDPTPVVDDDRWQEKLALLLQRPVSVVSLTFGLPSQADVAALQRVGTRVLASVTTAQEARRARARGVDGLVVQGAAAGGHSATHDPTRTIEPLATVELVRRVRHQVDLPIVAAGGVESPACVRNLLGAGAVAVAVGTLLLRTDEAGTSPAHSQALADSSFTETVITRAFTGRPARALRNGFIDRHPSAPSAYPAVHHLTRALRQRAGAAGDTDRLHLWAGTGWRNAATGPAGEVIRRLAGGL